MKITELLLEAQQADFVQQNYDTAKAVGDQLGVDPKLVLGHWALETGWGKNVIPGTNNLGNIKDFSGSGVKAYDKVEKSNDAYKAYKDSGEFANDYAKLLSKKFPGVVGAGSDPDAFIQGLQGGKYKYASGDLGKVYAGMPASVEKYLNPDNKWSLDPSKMIAKIKQAPDQVKNYISQNFPSVNSFINSFANTQTDEPVASSEEVSIMIDGKKKKFKNKKEAERALALAKEQGLDAQFVG